MEKINVPQEETTYLQNSLIYYSFTMLILANFQDSVQNQQ